MQTIDIKDIFNPVGLYIYSLHLFFPDEPIDTVTSW